MTIRLILNQFLTPYGKWNHENSDPFCVEHIFLELKLVERWKIHF